MTRRFRRRTRRSATGAFGRPRDTGRRCSRSGSTSSGGRRRRRRRRSAGPTRCGGLLRIALSAAVVTCGLGLYTARAVGEASACVRIWRRVSSISRNEPCKLTLPRRVFSSHIQLASQHEAKAQKEIEQREALKREIAPLKEQVAYWKGIANTIRTTWVPAHMANSEATSVQEAEQRKEEVAGKAAYIRKELGQIRYEKINAHQAREGTELIWFTFRPFVLAISISRSNTKNRAIPLGQSHPRPTPSLTRGLHPPPAHSG